MKLQMIQQEAERMNQQIQMIDQHISELNSVMESVVEISQKKSDKREILANLGKGIFIGAEIKGNELLVNVGKDILVKKTPEQTMKIIEEQLKKLDAGRTQFIERIGELQIHMQKIVSQAEDELGKKHGHNAKDENKHEHSCDNEECDCESECNECECGKK